MKIDDCLNDVVDVGKFLKINLKSVCDCRTCVKLHSNHLFITPADRHLNISKQKFIRLTDWELLSIPTLTPRDLPPPLRPIFHQDLQSLE